MNKLGTIRTITSYKKLDNNSKLDKLFDSYKQGINIIFMDNPADNIFKLCESNVFIIRNISNQISEVIYDLNEGNYYDISNS